ncbi:MAG TPA: S53 family peptidase [Xanthobacteraceae bacterium]|jgi:kumamolisin
MVEETSRKLLAISSPLAAPGTVTAGAVGDFETVTVDVLLRRRAVPPSIDALGALPLAARQHLTSEEFEAKYGADPDDVARVRAFAQAHGLAVRDVSLARRTVTLAGKAADLARAFSVGFARFASHGAVFRGHVGQASIPADLAPAVTAVLGLDERPIATPGLALHPGFSPADLAKARAVARVAAQNHLARATPQILQRLHAAYASDPAIKILSSRLGAAVGDRMLSALDGKPRAPALADVAGAAAAAQRSAGDIAARYQAELGELGDETSQAALLAYLNALGVRTPPQVAELYDFPPGTDGSGQCIGIIELGGGCIPADIEVYFKLIGVPMPTIVDVPVGNGANRPLLNPIVDSEVCLDIEVAGSVAPGAKIACYFSPCTALGFIGALSTAIHDRVNRPSAISISWSVSEAMWIFAPMVVSAFEDVLQDAALVGVTVCCAGGDYGATSEIHDGRAWVDYPSSSPYVLSCGGTTIYADPSGQFGQVAWNTIAIQGQATGGGVSELFPLPAWQQNAKVPPSINFGGRIGRGVPDVACVSDPLTGYFVRVDGNNMVMAGTSSAAPLWCALLARIAQSVGRPLGYINPLLYGLAGTDAFQDITYGNNGGYSAGPGWDACTGLGTPVGSKLLKAMTTAS